MEIKKQGNFEFLRMYCLTSSYRVKDKGLYMKDFDSIRKKNQDILVERCMCAHHNSLEPRS